MSTEEPKREVKIDNSAYRDKFRFLLSANENIICERFFKINSFNYASLHSEQLRDTIECIVTLIQDDLKSKSRIHAWYTTFTPVKLTGFKPNGMGMHNPDSVFVEYTENTPQSDEVKNEAEPELKPYDVAFRFDFQMAQKIETNPEDGKPIFSNYKSIYSAIWDATVYQKDVRNSVDLTNSMSSYKHCDLNMLNFARMLNYRMVNGKQDLIYDIIKRICDTTSGENKVYNTVCFYGTSVEIDPSEAKGFTKTSEEYDYLDRKGLYGDKEDIIVCDVYKDADKNYWIEKPNGKFMKAMRYAYDPYGEYVKSWDNTTRKKTVTYRRNNGFIN